MNIYYDSQSRTNFDVRSKQNTEMRFFGNLMQMRAQICMRTGSVNYKPQVQVRIRVRMRVQIRVRVRVRMQSMSACMQECMNFFRFI